jgi:biofilm PGA synthesis lipoprotein PgaB
VQRIQQHLGVRPRAIVWPYAAYNQLSNDIAEQLGMPVSFDLEGRSTRWPATCTGWRGCW